MNPARTEKTIAVGSCLLLAVMVLAPSIRAQDGGAPVGSTQDEPSKESAPVKKIKMYAENWVWTPSQIRVKQGTRVVLEIDSRDAPHAFQLKDYNLKVALPQDEKTRVEFVADKVGEFTFKCGRPCGNGCPKMRGKLIVLE